MSVPRGKTVLGAGGSGGERETARSELEARLQQLALEIDRLEARAASAGDETGGEIRDEIARLKARRDEAREHLDALEGAAEHEWEELRDRLETFWEELGLAIRDAANRLAP